MEGRIELTSAGTDPTPSRWQHRRPAPRPTSYKYLLDLDVELAELLDVRMRLVARPAVTAVIFDVLPGEIGLSEWLRVAAPGPGLLVLDGVVAVSVRTADRIAAELVGAGDLLQPWAGEDEELLFCDVRWRALVPTRFALLDQAFANRVAPWPQITAALLHRAGRRTRRLNIQRSIACQPRLEVRLALLLWHLAGRWGKVEPSGIRIPLPLTHQLLGRMIGAERPSVSHALSRLANAGLVRGHGDEWHLHGQLGDHLSKMLDLAGEPPEALLGAAASPRAS